MLNASLMNDTYNSLVVASPSAYSYPIAVEALLRMTSTNALSSFSSTRTATLSVASTDTTISSTPPKSQTSLSGGTIGGIVVGVLGGIAIVGVVVFLLWWRKHRYAAAAPREYAQPSGHGTNEHLTNSMELISNMPPAEKVAGQGEYVGEMPVQVACEMSAETGRRDITA
ncbi:hypothetical protein FB567DRAFT_74789 [Paraphoma chrysanthemicola]|uniref:Uncharacterized protein n=1 Tax=Paraphoma chrysanthemicola TaxID=798071 RepID=A0A8K0R360_9PLEO|nr:hypothetical protein FB567DRAFT_74789 [Paraphoma chrysanthemicola]